MLNKHLYNIDNQHQREIEFMEKLQQGADSDYLKTFARTLAGAKGKTPTKQTEQIWFLGTRVFGDE